MAMNPQEMIKFMSALNTFKGNHPKFISFIKAVAGGGVPVDTVMELTVTKPGEEPITTNIKVCQSDLDLFESLKSKS